MRDLAAFADEFESGAGKPAILVGLGVGGSTSVGSSSRVWDEACLDARLATASSMLAASTSSSATIWTTQSTTPTTSRSTSSTPLLAALHRSCSKGRSACLLPRRPVFVA